MSREPSTSKLPESKEPVTVGGGPVEQEGKEDRVEMVVDPCNDHSSLRHFFYLEYKRNFPEGQVNPIVYSRFGK